jgi:hypothetical protein
MKTQRFPPGWDEDRVREVLAHYEGQSEDEPFAEIEATREAEGMTMMAIPTELVPGSPSFTSCPARPCERRVDRGRDR